MCLLYSPQGMERVFYQLSAIVDAGIGVIIAPLISLLEAQQAELQRLGIPAEALKSRTTKSVAPQIYADILSVNERVPDSSNQQKTWQES